MSFSRNILSNKFREDFSHLIDMMRKFIVFIITMLSMAAAHAQSFDSVPKEKTAILMVHFGRPMTIPVTRLSTQLMKRRKNIFQA